MCARVGVWGWGGRKEQGSKIGTDSDKDVSRVEVADQNRSFKEERRERDVGVGMNKKP